MALDSFMVDALNNQDCKARGHYYDKKGVLTICVSPESTVPPKIERPNPTKFDSPAPKDLYSIITETQIPDLAVSAPLNNPNPLASALFPEEEENPADANYSPIENRKALNFLLADEELLSKTLRKSGIGVDDQRIINSLKKYKEFLDGLEDSKMKGNHSYETFDVKKFFQAAKGVEEFFNIANDINLDEINDPNLKEIVQKLQDLAKNRSSSISSFIKDLFGDLSMVLEELARKKTDIDPEDKEFLLEFSREIRDSLGDLEDVSDLEDKFNSYMEKGKSRNPKMAKLLEEVFKRVSSSIKIKDSLELSLEDEDRDRIIEEIVPFVLADEEGNRDKAREERLFKDFMSIFSGIQGMEETDKKRLEELSEEFDSWSELYKDHKNGDYIKVKDPDGKERAFQLSDLESAKAMVKEYKTLLEKTKNTLRSDSSEKLAELKMLEVKLEELEDAVLEVNKQVLSTTKDLVDEYIKQTEEEGSQLTEDDKRVLRQFSQELSEFENVEDIKSFIEKSQTENLSPKMKKFLDALIPAISSKLRLSVNENDKSIEVKLSEEDRKKILLDIGARELIMADEDANRNPERELRAAESVNASMKDDRSGRLAQKNSEYFGAEFYRDSLAKTYEFLRTDGPNQDLELAEKFKNNIVGFEHLYQSKFDKNFYKSFSDENNLSYDFKNDSVYQTEAANSSETTTAQETEKSQEELAEKRKEKEAEQHPLSSILPEAIVREINALGGGPDAILAILGPFEIYDLLMRGLLSAGLEEKIKYNLELEDPKRLQDLGLLEDDSFEIKSLV